MISASEELGYVRPRVVAAIAKLCAGGLSTMDAYTRFGTEIGKSERWVRKIVGRDETAGIRLRDAWNIEAACRRLCARIDGVSERIEASTERMREERHAREGAVRDRSRAAEAVAGRSGLVPGVDTEERS